jgi:uncharacterized protein involved in cysteine biosynthesis
MLLAFSKGISQLNDRATRKVLGLCIGSALAAFAALLWIVGFLLTATVLFSAGWLETVVDLLGGLAALVLTWFLFPGVISVLVGLFLEKIAEAVEARHYPGLPPADGLTLTATLVTMLRYLGALVFLNLLLLPFLLFPPVFPFVFYTVNGYLLGREYFELVALRRVGPADMRRLRKANRGRLFVAGVVVTLLLTIPVVNLLAPVVATAAMVHLFEDWRKEAPKS